MKTLLRAAYVATMAGPVIEAGEIVVEGGRIVAVGRGLREGHADAEVVELGDAVVLPGLVNAHAHLELTAVGQLRRPASFVDWILDLRHRMGFVTDWAQATRDATTVGVQQCLRYGVTAVGDISLNPAASRAVLSASPLRGVSFGEVLGMAGRAGQMEGRIEAAVDRSFERDGLRAGIEPHAPYSLDLAGYRRCVEEAKRRGMPLATHLAETPDEAEFLANHSGAFARLWAALGGWEGGVSRAEGGPIRVMASMGLLELPAVLAHVNYVDDAELDVLARGQASVVYCPRTHSYFGHPPHRFREMLARGTNVALGTDSVASSGDLNLMEDARLVNRIAPQLSAEEVLAMITSRGARALGMASEAGRLLAPMRADFSVWPVDSSDPLAEILERDVDPRETWIGGRKVWERPAP